MADQLPGALELEEINATAWQIPLRLLSKEEQAGQRGDAPFFLANQQVTAVENVTRLTRGPYPGAVFRYQGLIQVIKGRLLHSLHFVSRLSFGVGQAQDVVHSQALVLPPHSQVDGFARGFVYLSAVGHVDGQDGFALYGEGETLSLYWRADWLTFLT